MQAKAKHTYKFPTGQHVGQKFPRQASDGGLGIPNMVTGTVTMC